MMLEDHHYYYGCSTGCPPDCFGYHHIRLTPLLDLETVVVKCPNCDIRIHVDDLGRHVQKCKEFA